MTTTYSFKEIWETIYNKLLEIKSTRVWEVYNHDVKIESWISLPAIIINPSDWWIEYLDSCNYEENINFTVRVIDRIQDGIATVEDNIRILADEVLGKLKEMNDIVWSSSNWRTVKFTIDYQWWFTDTQEPLRAFIVNLHFTAITK